MGEFHIINKIDELRKEIKIIKDDLCEIKEIVVQTNNALSKYITNFEMGKEKEDKMVKDIESQLKLFPDMFKDGGFDMSNVKNITSSVEGASEKLKSVLKNYEKKFNKP